MANGIELPCEDCKGETLEASVNANGTIHIQCNESGGKRAATTLSRESAAALMKWLAQQ